MIACVCTCEGSLWGAQEGHSSCTSLWRYPWEVPFQLYAPLEGYPRGPQVVPRTPCPPKTPNLGCFRGAGYPTYTYTLHPG